MNAKKKSFYGVQILRGVAALLVVMFHVGTNLREHSDFTSVPAFYFGNGGVDLFFLISGFVIFSTTVDQWQVPGAWANFLKRRFTRIVPLYWLVTSIKLAFLVTIPMVLEQPELNAWQTVASFLFIPAWNSSHSTIAIISAGWTLCFEMFFYFACALCLAFGARPLIVMTPVFIGLALFGAFRTEAWGAPATLLNPLLLEFVVGMWIGSLALTKRAGIGTSTASVILTAGCLALIASSFVAPEVAYRMRVLLWGIPAAAILIAFVALENKVDFSTMRLPLLLGNASYAIYLTELAVRPIISSLRYYRLGVAGEFVVFGGVVVVALCIGILVYYLVEQPLLRGVRAAMTASKPRMRASLQS